MEQNKKPWGSARFKRPCLGIERRYTDDRVLGRQSRHTILAGRQTDTEEKKQKTFKDID